MFETSISGLAAPDGALADRPAAIASLLKQTDRIYADVIELLMRGGLPALTGMPAEMVLTTEAGRTWGDARMLVQAAEVLRHMPRLFALLRRGEVSWAQVRGIVCAVSRLRVAEHDEVDQWIAHRAPALANVEADRLVAEVDAEVMRRRPDLTLAREDRAVSRNSLWLQQRFDGGSDIGGRADAEATATIAEALDFMADDPVHPADGPARAEQHLEAFVRMAEHVLSGESGGAARPRPRLYATFDVAGLTDESREQGIELLTALAGRAPRLSNVARDTLSCDATIVPVIFDGARVLEVGDESSTFPDKVRTAIIARDRRCRWCGAPAAWCDAHHIVWGSGRTADDGVLLCRRCHRRVHRYTWSMRWGGDGFLEFSRRGRKFLSPPP